MEEATHKLRELIGNLKALRDRLTELRHSLELSVPQAVPRLDLSLFFVNRALSSLEAAATPQGLKLVVQTPGETMDIEVESDLLELNKRIAEENRKYLDQMGVLAIDIMGSLGAGKTTLIEALVRSLKEKYGIAVITGDVSTSIDAERILKLGVKALQVNTGKECHLDAHLIRRALQALDLRGVDVLLIENVGNLICPADFPLGAHKRVVVISVSEGSDMVIKHPSSFKEVDVVVINKVDVAKDFDVDPSLIARDVEKVNPKAKVVYTSAKTGLGINKLIEALEL